MAALLIAALMALAIGFGIGLLLPSRLIPTAYLLVASAAIVLFGLGKAEEQQAMPEDQSGLVWLTLGVLWAIVVLAPSMGALLGFSPAGRRAARGAVAVSREHGTRGVMRVLIGAFAVIGFAFVSWQVLPVGSLQQWYWEVRGWDSAFLMGIGALLLIAAFAVIAYLRTPRDNRL